MQNIALIGMGFIGSNHAQAIGKIPHAHLSCIVEINEEAGRKAAEEFGCKHYKTPDEALANEKIDFVIICLPTFLHEQYVLWAAENKLNILCEKPFTLTLESVDKMFETCSKNGVRLMVAQAARWTPEMAHIRDMYQQGQFGDIHMVVAKRLGQHPNWSTWHTDPNKSGGGLYDLNIHDLDFLVGMFGKVDRVNAIGWQTKTGCWNHVVSNIWFKNGAMASVEASMQMPDDFPFSVGYRVVGDKGGVDFNFSAGFNIKADATTSFLHFENGSSAKQVAIPSVDIYQGEIESFITSIETNSPFAVPNEESRDVIQLTLAIKESLEKKEIVYL